MMGADYSEDSDGVFSENVHVTAGKIRVGDGTHEVDVVYDTKTGRTSLLVSRAHGKTTFTEEYSADQTALAIIAPASGKRLCISEIMTAADTNSGNIELDFATSSIKVWRHYVSLFGSMLSQAVHVEGAVGESLTLNSTTGANDIFVVVSYREVV